MEPGPKEDVPISHLSPDGSMTINIGEMVPGEHYSLLYFGKEPAIAVRGKDNSLRFTRVFDHTRNPVIRLINKLREPILTTPPCEVTDPRNTNFNGKILLASLTNLVASLLELRLKQPLLI